MTNTSILTSTKKALGLEEDYEVFDAELIMFINSVLGTFNQLGLGPDDGFSIEDKTALWETYLGDHKLLYNNAQALMFLQVKMLFDPPTTGEVLAALERQIEQAIWRVNVAREDAVYPLPPPLETDPSEIGEEFILDGGGG